MTKKHRFRPRYRGMAWSAIGVAGAAGIAGIAASLAATPLVIAAVGASFGLLYLGSPTWKTVVITDDDGIEVQTPRKTVFRLGWRDIRRVVVSASKLTAFVDGGSAERSLLVPGDGAPAPYMIEDAGALVATILARVTPDRIENVESLDRATKSEQGA
ncbi:MAG: hypothetical protein ACKV2T_13205 [Kofleriaceae bacterium]